MSNLKTDMRRERPRLVSYPELVAKLMPKLLGWKWAQDALRDLWLLGAPVPQDRCPGNKPCKAYPRCNHIRRVLYPQQFEKWWDEVCQRQSLGIAARTMLDKTFK